MSSSRKKTGRGEGGRRFSISGVAEEGCDHGRRNSVGDVSWRKKEARRHGRQLLRMETNKRVQTYLGLNVWGKRKIDRRESM